MRKSSLALAFITGLALVACKTNPSEFEGFTKAENGLYYKFGGTHDEKGTKPQIGDMLKLYYRFALTKNDSVILDSKKDSREGNGIVAIPMFKSSFKGSIEDGISMMCKGDSATFIVAADSFFLKTMMAKELPKNVKPGDKVTACIKLHDIKPTTGSAGTTGTNSTNGRAGKS